MAENWTVNEPPLEVMRISPNGERVRFNSVSVSRAEAVDVCKRFLRFAAPTAEREPSQPCTGIVARWCPVHGTCTCDLDQSGAAWIADPACPLHGLNAKHPVVEEPSLSSPTAEGEALVIRDTVDGLLDSDLTELGDTLIGAQSADEVRAYLKALLIGPKGMRPGEPEPE